MALPSKGEAEGSKVDPHWWQDPRNAEAAVREIERLSSKPTRSPRRDRRNADSYLARLRGLDRCDRGLHALDSGIRRRLVTDHDAFEYFARRYGSRSSAQ